MVAGGYCMYGGSTEMVLSVGDGVNVFSHDPALGEFLLTK
jgi:fructose-1,6-bisphosphatase I